MAEFGTSVSVLAKESSQVVTETVTKGVPEAVNNVQEQISTMVGGAKEAKDSISDCEFHPRGGDEGLTRGVALSEESQVDGEHIENMSNERVCDFLRQKNMSNARSN